jgi:hypothetical protein
VSLLLFLLQFHQLTVCCYRICSLAFIASVAVFQSEPKVSDTYNQYSDSPSVAPVNKCSQLDKSVGILFFFAVTSTSLLFFFRTRAVFDRNPWIVAFFAILWLAVVGACLTVIIGVNGVNIGSTRYCIEGSVKPFVTTAAIIPLINDTFVFLAITWRLADNSYARPTLKDGLRVLIFGDYLPKFSKAMLQDGQAYYLSISLSLIYSCLTS